MMRRTLATIATAMAAAVGLMAAVPTMAQADNTPSLSACADRLLIVGSSGPCVKSLQQSLLALPGFGDAFDADGLYGPRTRLAVLYYQGWAGLQQDGMAGPITIGNLDRDANRPTPAGRPAELPHMPDRSATFLPGGNAVQTTSMPWVHTYYGRATTRRLNDAFGRVAADEITTISSSAICAAAGIGTGGVGGGVCSALISTSGFALKQGLQDAVDHGACLEVKTTNYGLNVASTEFVANGDNNCTP